MHLGLIDYGSGNYESVRNAFLRLGYEPISVRTGQDFDRCERLVLPGVGSFRGCMERLEDRGLTDPLVSAVGGGRPLLGICVGLQVLATEGDEHGTHPGLGLIPGRVRKVDTGSPSLPLPHIGWNDCTIHRSSALTEGLGSSPEFYFVHSYHFVPENSKDLVATSVYGESVTAIVESGNVMGVQFHPEKSQSFGLQLLQNFLDMTC